MFIIIILPRTFVYGNEQRLYLFGIRRLNDGVAAVNKTLISAVMLFSNVICSKQLRPAKKQGLREDSEAATITT